MSLIFDKIKYNRGLAKIYYDCGSPGSAIAIYDSTLTAAIAELNRLTARNAELEGDPRDVVGDTGHIEADRLLGRLASSDPDFCDIHAAAILIRKLVVEHRGPDGFATWKDAAVHERLRRKELEAMVPKWQYVSEELYKWLAKHKYPGGETLLHAGVLCDYQGMRGMINSMARFLESLPQHPEVNSEG